MANFEARLLGSAKAFLAAASQDEKAAVKHIIESILCFDPYLDLHCKIRLPAPPGVLTLYFDKRFWVVYHLVHNTEIEIWNIGRAHDTPTPY